MPLFEVDASRPLLVQSGRSGGAVEPGLGTTAHRVVDSHIDGLLGEQIFPVAQGVGPDEPHLLALDATGSPVVVELVGELDRSALTRALDHAGWAGRLTRGELASRYHGGPASFQRDVAAFYDSVPITRSQPGRSSARLIIICQEAGEEILNAVDFLRQPTMPVEVLKMGVMHSEDGRRFVDVSPLVIHPASGATAPQLSGAVAAAAARDGDGTFAEGVKVGLALTGRQPVVAAPPAEPAVGTGTAAQPFVARPASARRAEPAVPTATRSAARAAAAAAAPDRPAERRTERPAEQPAERRAEAPAERPAAPRSRAARREQSGPRSLALPAVPPPPAPTTDRTPVPPPPPAAPEPPRRRSRADRFRPGAPAPEVTPELAAFTAASAGSAEDLDLAELARRTTSPASADTATLGEDFARAAAPSFRRSVPRPEPAPWDPPAPRAPEPAPWEPSARRAADPAPWDPPSGRVADPLDTSVPLSSPGERAWSPSTPERWTSASDDLPRLEVPPLEAPSYTPPPERDLYDTGVPAPEVDEVDGDLIALASMLGHPTRLVWERPRRRQRFDAVLHPDGVIELPDGALFRHPDRAATAASGAATDDGWNVWRLEPEGLSLLEAYRARFA